MEKLRRKKTPLRPVEQETFEELEPVGAAARG
jgi:hypothetical protein